MKNDRLISRIEQLTVPSSDDGVIFTRTDRLARIRAALEDSHYRCLADLPLAKIYHHVRFRERSPFLLISNHIDSAYEDYYFSKKKGMIYGTLDNSACNGVVVELMVKGRLPPQTLVAFTGDEEDGCAGVDQIMQYLSALNAMIGNLEVVIVLDLTEEFFESHHYSIENYFVRRQGTGSALHFDKKRDFRTYLDDKFQGKSAFLLDAEPDESWEYDEHDMNCFSFCLPCRLLGRDMHSTKGVAIKLESVKKYAEALTTLAQAIEKDLVMKNWQSQKVAEKY